MAYQLTSRPFTMDDLPAVRAFVGVYTAAADLCTNLHPGDVLHYISNILRGAPPEPHFWLFYGATGDDISAIVMLYDPRDPAIDVMVHPSLTPDAADLDGLFAFGEAKLIALLDEAGSDAVEMGYEVLECALDPLRQAVMAARGYTPGEPLFVITRQPIDRPLPDPVLPDGFTIRSAAGIDEADAIGALHARVFPSDWSEGRYATVMASPAYRADDELLVVAPDGTLVAFCIIWFDPVSKSGMFEPVGCHPDFQRRGLTRALLIEGMRRMQAQGMTVATVKHRPPEQRPGAAAFYRALGYVAQGTGIDYRKRIR